MAASFTQSPDWIKKMKMRFHLLDADMNGILDNDDIALVAKRVAAYRNEGPDTEHYYVESIESVFMKLSEKQGLNEEEFVESARKFVSQPDAEVRVKEFADNVFEIVDANKDGVISKDEYTQFYRALNASQEMIDGFFNTADTNGDGFINRSEIRESYVKFFFTG